MSEAQLKGNSQREWCEAKLEQDRTSSMKLNWMCLESASPSVRPNQWSWCYPPKCEEVPDPDVLCYNTNIEMSSAEMHLGIVRSDDNSNRTTTAE